MFCKNCGAQLADDTRFCTQCGTPVVTESAQPVIEPQPQPEVNPQPTQPVYDNPYQQTYGRPAPANNGLVTSPSGITPVKVLVWGIIAAALGEFGILGIIFGAIAKKKADTFTAETGCYSTMVKTGRILGKVGLILGIVMTIFWVVYIALIAGVTAFSIIDGTRFNYYY